MNQVVRTYVEDLYRGILRREPDQHGLESSVRRLQTPTFDGAAKLLHDFLQSNEYKSKVAGPFSNWNNRRNLLSIGSHCLTSATLNKYGLKQFSAPFDWIFSSIPIVADCIEDEFSAFLDKKYHAHVPVEHRKGPTGNFCHHTLYRERYGLEFMFNHYDISIDDNYEYYQRCVARFIRCLQSDEENILVGVCPPHKAQDRDIDRLISALQRYSTTKIVLFVSEKNKNGKIGIELQRQIQHHSIYRIHLSEQLGSTQFVNPVDEALFCYTLSRQ